MDGHTDRQINGQMYGHTDKLKNRLMVGHRHRHIDKWIDGWTD